jgi:hypothetical protein
LTCAPVALAARAGQFMLLECVAASERRAFRRGANRPWSAERGFTVDPKLPLLRRPFGFHRLAGPDYAPERLAEQPPFAPALAAATEPARAETFDVAFKVVGRGTKRLAQMRPGERLSLRAPLGAPVVVHPDLETAILVGAARGAA